MKRLLSLITVLAMFAAPAMAASGTSPDIPSAFGWFAVALGAYMALPMLFRSIGLRLSMIGFLATVISTTALNAAYGAQYANGSKSLKDLKSQLFESSDFDKFFTIEYTDLTTWEKSVGSMSSMLQRYQKAFTPNGTITFTPSKYDLHDAKIDAQWTPRDIKNGFLGFMEKVGGKPDASMLTKYLVSLIEKKFPEDVELHAAWGGVRGSVTPGTATAPDEAIDGFRKTINDGITATTITPIAVGAVPTDPQDMVAYIEEFVQGITNKYKKIPMKLAMNLTNEEIFKEGMRLKYKTYYDDGKDVTKVYTRPNIQVVGSLAMGDSGKVWCSPMDNLYKVINLGESRELVLNWETVDRSYKVWGDIMMRYCIWDHEAFFTNDVDTGAGS